MKYKKMEIKKGIKLHTIRTNKFKTNLIAIMITTKLQKGEVTKNSLIPTVLRRGTEKLRTQEEINKKLEEMYGASFDCGIDKTGDNQVLKFYLESISDDFTPNDEKILKQSIEQILEIIFNPYLENGSFKKEYVEQEKENLKQIIEGKIDNKARYALDRCIEEMYKEQPYGLYKYGYTQDIENINEKNLFEQYQKLINEAKIDIFVSGIFEEDIKDIIENNQNIKNLKEREAKYEMPKVISKKAEQEKEIEEKMDVSQGKLVIGLDINSEGENLRYNTMIYNSILGGSANSKLFQNVREKESLAYTASSSYMRFKNNIFINCGIEIGNYKKTLEIIKKQLEDMKNGDFSDEEIENSKKGIVDTIKTIDDEQDTEITYFFGQELTQGNQDLEEYIEKIKQVKRQDVIEVAKSISVDTVYFLRN